MKNPATRNGRTHPSPALAASVGLGTITLDTILVPTDRPLRVGGGAGCDLPFTCEPADLVVRRDGAWIVRLPDGVDRDGPADATREIRLRDWDGGVTLSGGDGAAWLRLWPTRRERFQGRDRLAGPRWLVTRALPALWIAASLTLALGTFALWASTAVRGDLNVLSLGDGALGDGGDLERVASLGDGQQAAGMSLGAWASQPTPPAPEMDAVAEAEAETEPETETESETQTGTQSSSTGGDADASAGDASTGAQGVKSGGAGGFGLGGGTDDGYADRTESVKALERSLIACLEGDDTHRIKLMVGNDGKVEHRSLDYSHGEWDRSERACVGKAIEEWAFPSAEQSYEVSLRMRVGSRRHRV